MKEELHDCSGCTDPRSEGTHQGHTKQHPCPEGGDPHCGYCFPHQNEAEWRNSEPWVSIEGKLWDLLGKQTDIPSVMDEIKAALVPKAQIAEVVNPDELAERIVIDYANRSGRDDNRPEVRDAARAVLEAVREKLLGNEGKGV